MGIQAIRHVRIGVIGHEIQTFARHPMIIQITEQAIGSDKISWLDIFSQNIALQLRPPAGTVGHKALVIQYLMRICVVAESGARNVYLPPGRIGLIPEDGSPGGVQCLNRSVFLLQKFPLP